MTLEKLQQHIDMLSIILMKPFSFNGITIEANFISRAKHSKNWNVATHIHPWYEFNYVSKGSVYTSICDKEFLVTAKQSYIIPPGVPHSHRNNQTGDDGLCIRFSISAQNNRPETKRIIELLSEPRPYSFDSKIEKMRLNGYLLSTQALFASWLMCLYEKWGDNKSPITEIPRSTTSSQVIQYLKEYHSNKIKVEDVANALHISYRNLARNFKLETGITISEQLNLIRLEKAKELLRSTKLSIRKIAILSGFENEYYFSKKFKKHEKISPSHYRNSGNEQ